jgi:hypothetical protein
MTRTQRRRRRRDSSVGLRVNLCSCCRAMFIQQQSRSLIRASSSPCTRLHNWKLKKIREFTSWIKQDTLTVADLLIPSWASIRCAFSYKISDQFFSWMRKLCQDEGTIVSWERETKATGSAELVRTLACVFTHAFGACRFIAYLSVRWFSHWVNGWFPAVFCFVV